jgi:hypothetical protein
MSMTEVSNPGAKCSTGQPRSVVKKPKKKRKKYHKRSQRPEKKRRKTFEPNYLRKVRAPVYSYKKA